MNHWYEQFQRQAEGRSTAEETEALANALRHDAQLRALYLDHLNLEAGLRALAQDQTADEALPFPPPAAPPRRSLWLAAAAGSAAAAAVVSLAWAVLRSPAPPPSLGPAAVELSPSAVAVLEETQRSIARLSLPPTASPLGASPTASLLARPDRPQ